MKRIAVIYLAVILILIPVMAVGCSSGNVENEDTVAIKAVIQDYFDAVNEGDYELALTYFSDYILWEQSNYYPDAVLSIMPDKGDTIKEFVKITIDEKDNIAFALLSLHTRSNAIGKAARYEISLTKTEDGSWKLIPWYSIPHNNT